MLFCPFSLIQQTTHDQMHACNYTIRCFPASFWALIYHFSSDFFCCSRIEYYFCISSNLFFSIIFLILLFLFYIFPMFSPSMFSSIHVLYVGRMEFWRLSHLKPNSNHLHTITYDFAPTPNCKMHGEIIFQCGIFSHSVIERNSIQ